MNKIVFEKEVDAVEMNRLDGKCEEVLARIKLTSPVDLNHDIVTPGPGPARVDLYLTNRQAAEMFPLGEKVYITVRPVSQLLDHEQTAHALYDEYCAAVGGVAFNGDPLPKSAEFFADTTKEKQANAWRASALKLGELLG